MSKLARTSCMACPFVVGSGFGYEKESMEALADGLVPACHVVVGAVVFSSLKPSPNETCVGYERWVDGCDGFARPAAVDRAFADVLVFEGAPVVRRVEVVNLPEVA